ncbi:MAG: hypothetical protein EXS30_09660 [Pedosphaera sp.]|nr:hypothetical protein [Pedosphaera sp.]
MAASFGGGTIKNLSTGNGGVTTLPVGGITTAGTQTYGDAVTLGVGTTVLTSSGAGNAGNITFGSTINGTTANTEYFEVDTQGTTTFGGSIGLGSDGIYGGDDKNLAVLVTNPGGVTILSGGTVFVTDLIFSDTVILGNGTVIKGINVDFNGETAILGGGNSLTLSSTGQTVIGGNVSGVSSLIRDVGTTVFEAWFSGIPPQTVTTIGAQVYSGAIELVYDAVFTGSNITSLTTPINVPGTTTALTIPGITTVTGKTLTVNIVP